MDWFLEVLVSKIWILNEHLERILRMGRRFLATGNQLRMLARRGRNPLPVMPKDSADYYVEAVKRRHSEAFPSEGRRRTLYHAVNIGHIIYLDDESSRISDQSASNGGNLYVGTTSTKANRDGDDFVNTANIASNDEANTSCDKANNGGNLYGGNGTTGTKASYHGNEFDNTGSLTI